MHYRGAFHLCLKQNPKKEKRRGGGGGKKSSGLGVFLTMLVICLYTILKPAERLQLPPSTAQTLRPLRLGGGGLSEAVKLVCVCVFRGGMTNRDVENLRRKAKPAGLLLSLSFFLFMSVHVSL